MTRLLILVCALSTAAILACKKDEPPAGSPLEQLAESGKKVAEASAKMQEASAKGPAAMGEAMKQMGEVLKAGGAVVDPVDFRKLKALLPADLPGLKRTEASGEKAGGMGMVVAQASGRYEGEGGQSVNIKIIDFGGATGVGAMAAFGWASVEVDRETENGYEKTTTIAGHKAKESYNREGKNGDVQLMVANRFMVEIETNGLQADEMKALVSKVDLGALASLK